MKEVYDNFTVEYTPDTHSVEFSIYEIVGHQGKDFKEPIYSSIETNQETTKLSEAEIYLKGFVKWDGCSHFYFNEYLHICGGGDIIKLGEIVKKVYDRCGELMDSTLDGEFPAGNH